MKQSKLTKVEILLGGQTAKQKPTVIAMHCQRMTAGCQGIPDSRLILGFWLLHQFKIFLLNGAPTVFCRQDYKGKIAIKITMQIN